MDAPCLIDFTEANGPCCLVYDAVSHIHVRHAAQGSVYALPVMMKLSLALKRGGCKVAIGRQGHVQSGESSAVWDGRGCIIGQSHNSVCLGLDGSING